MLLDVALLDPQSTRNAGASRTAKAKPLEGGSNARRVVFFGRAAISRYVRICGAERYSMLLPSLELPPASSNSRLDLFVAPAEELRDRLAEGSLISEPGLKRGSAVSCFVARNHGARRGAQKVGKLRLREVRVAAVALEVVGYGPSVEMHHGDMKNRRRERGVGKQAKPGGRRGRTLSGRRQTTHELTQNHVAYYKPL